MTSQLFLLIDHLWHVRREEGGVGDPIYSFLKSLPNLPQGFRVYTFRDHKEGTRFFGRKQSRIQGKETVVILPANFCLIHHRSYNANF